MLVAAVAAVDVLFNIMGTGAMFCQNLLRSLRAASNPLILFKKPPPPHIVSAATSFFFIKGVLLLGFRI